MYTLIGNPKTRAFRVLWGLEELEAEYTIIPDPPHGPMPSKTNPTGKIPVMLDGEEPIIDSVAILTYLSDKHGQMTHPAGTLERARQDSMTQFLCDEMDAVLWTYARNSFINPDDKRSADIGDILKWEFPRSMQALSERLGDSEFMAGDIFTVPDILACHLTGWAGRAGFEIGHDNITDHCARMMQRPAYARADAIRNPPEA